MELLLTGMLVIRMGASSRVVGDSEAQAARVGRDGRKAGRRPPAICSGHRPPRHRTREEGTMVRRRPTPDEMDARRWSSGTPIPDGDTVAQPGYRPWVDLLAEHTELMPVLDEPVVRPYLVRLFRRFR
jgi:hypothetical protein